MLLVGPEPALEPNADCSSMESLGEYTSYCTMGNGPLEYQMAHERNEAWDCTLHVREELVLPYPATTCISFLTTRQQNEYVLNYNTYTGILLQGQREIRNNFS
jgi:hypothetical protein